MKVDGFSKKNEYVPEIDSNYKFDRDTTLAILSGFAYDKIENSKLEELIVTDSIPSKKESSKIKILSCADLFAEVMTNVNSNKSISTKFLM